MLQELFNIFIQKKPIKQMIAERPGFTKGIVAFFVIYIAVQIITSIESLLISAVRLVFPVLFIRGDALGDVLAALLQIVPQAIFSAISLPAGLIISLAILFIGGGISYIIARLFGVKGGGYIQYINNLLLLAAAFTLVPGVIIIVLSLPGLIPIVGGIVALLLLIPAYLAFFVYFLYLCYKLIKHYFNLSTGKAVIVLLVPIIIGAVIIGIILIVMAVFFTAWLLTMAGLVSGAVYSSYAILPAF